MKPVLVGPFGVVCAKEITGKNINAAINPAVIRFIVFLPFLILAYSILSECLEKK